MEIIQQVLNGVAFGSILILFSLGFALVFGIMDVVNMAQGALLMVGGFLGVVVTRGLELPLLLGLMAGALGAGLLNVICEAAFLKPLNKRSGTTLAGFGAIVLTLGFATIIQVVVQQITHTKVYSYPSRGWYGNQLEVAGLHLNALQLIAIGIAVAFSLFLAWFLNRSRSGIRLRAAASDHDAARLIGIPVELVTSLVFFTSGALAGIAGVLIGVTYNSVHFLMGDRYLLLAFVVIAVGGLGSVAGSVVMGLLVGIIYALVGTYADSTWASIAVFGLLFIILVVRPGGLFGDNPRTAGTDRV